MGVYANLARVWHTKHEFTIDFAAVPDSPPASDDEAETGFIVARVKVPTSVIFGIAQSISHDVAAYETQHGALTPRPPDEESHP